VFFVDDPHHLKQLPNYPEDLNAMREAVMAQSGDFRLRYRNILADICGAQHYHDASADIRADAFLQALSSEKLK
jgi:hypothetical protein